MRILEACLDRVLCDGECGVECADDGAVLGEWKWLEGIHQV